MSELFKMIVTRPLLFFRTYDPLKKKDNRECGLKASSKEIKLNPGQWTVTSCSLLTALTPPTLPLRLHSLSALHFPLPRNNRSSSVVLFLHALCKSVSLVSDLPPTPTPPPHSPLFSSHCFAPPPLPPSHSCHPLLLLLILPLVVSSPYFQPPPPPPPPLPAEVGCQRCHDNGATGASAARPVIILERESALYTCGACFSNFTLIAVSSIILHGTTACMEPAP